MRKEMIEMNDTDTLRFKPLPDGYSPNARAVYDVLAMNNGVMTCVEIAKQLNAEGLKTKVLTEFSVGFRQAKQGLRSLMSFGIIGRDDNAYFIKEDMIWQED